MDATEFERAKAELPVLRGFIDFVNRQVGVYSDCLAGFSGNKARIERQIPRVQRPSGRRIQDGKPVIVWTSVEDPTLPDIVHQRIIRADDFLSSNAEGGLNERQTCWAIIVFIFAYWDEDVRPKIASIRGVETKAVVLDELGDLRILRMSIVHDGGYLSAAMHAKMKVIHHLCKPDAEIVFSHEQMHHVFIHVKRAIGRLILKYTGSLPGAPNPSEIVGVAIQNP